MDYFLFQKINGLAGRWPLLDAAGGFAARWLIFVMFAAVAVRAFVAARRPETRPLMALLATAELRALCAGALAFAGNWAFSLAWFRPRPYVTHPDAHVLLAQQLTHHAFPSGHSSAAFAVAFTVLLVDLPFGLALLGCAALVALGRVFVGVHYPGDVLAGVLVGLLWALAMQALGTRAHDLETVQRWLNAYRVGRKG